MAEQKVNVLSIKEKILFVLVQLFFVSILIQFNDVVTGVITGGMMLCCLLFNGFREKWQLVKERKHILWMFLFFTWLFISLLMSEDKYEGFRFLDPRLPLFYFPLTIGLISISKELKQKILLGISTVTSLYCLACMIWGISNFVKTNNVDFLYNDWLSALTGQQSIYISVLVNISIYIYAWFVFFKKTSYRFLCLTAMLFLFAMSYMLASRNMMLILYASVIYFIVYYIVKKKQYLYGATLLLLLAVAGFFVFKFFPKTINRFKEIVYTNFDYSSNASESHYTKAPTKDQWNGSNFRLAAWQCGWELFKENPVLGTGLGDKKAALNRKYEEKNFQFAIRTKKNLHNNYLDILTATGVIGFIIFLSGWLIIPIRSVHAQSDYLSILIILTFAFAMITEVYFDRSLGGLLFGFFVPFLLTDYPSGKVLQR